ncbi:G5 domain-containing protein, partial [bacterium]|nr:G5 domain-containing protein [bacterium]
QTSVGATLKEEGVVVGPLDAVTPATNERIRDGMKITVVRVSESIEELRQPIGFETVKAFTKSLRPGQVKVTRTGQRGEKVVRYKVRYHDGTPVMRTKIESVVVKKPVNQVVSIGSRGRYTSRGEYRTTRVLNMSASAYDPGPRSCGKWASGRTSCGMRAGYGVVAVDPRVIRLGTRLYVEGYGHAIAGDVGRAIKGNRIDLGFDTYREAIRFGRKKVSVHVLE